MYKSIRNNRTNYLNFKNICRQFLNFSWSILVNNCSFAQYCKAYVNTPKHCFYTNSKKQSLLTGVLIVDVRTFLFKGFFFSPSSIIKEPVSMSLSVALAVGNSVASAPSDKLSIIITN